MEIKHLSHIADPDEKRDAIWEIMVYCLRPGDLTLYHTVPTFNNPLKESF